MPKPKSSRRRAAKRSRTSSARSAPARDPAKLAALADDALLEAVQRQTFRYFWDAAHPVSGLAYDRRSSRKGAKNLVDDPVAIGGSGFGAMALIVAAERGWISRDSALDRLGRMLELLSSARCYHGAFPHFMNGRTGKTVPFGRKDDGGDLVETSLLMMGLLCAREYFGRPGEAAVRGRISQVWEEVEWSWFTRESDVLFWHWSPYNGWAMNHQIRGWNECLITYVLAASSPRYAIDAEIYHRGYASNGAFRNDKPWYDIELPLGMAYGGPLFFAHYSFLGLDPRGLTDRYADYWAQNVHHVQINRAHCIANPGKFVGYGDSCWGLTASDDPWGYSAHAPDNDNGTISPTAALASLPYAPVEVMTVLRHFLQEHGKRLWRNLGFVDAFCESEDWYADTFLAIDQGPIVAMIENHRTALLWKLFMAVPEVQSGLRKLGFSSPHFGEAEP